MLLKNKTALITGSNRGIGLAILKSFAKNGCNIYAHSRNQTDDFNSLISSISKEFNVRIININFDLRDKNEIKSKIKKIIKSKESLDILVNSAGIIHGGLFQMTQISEIKDVFDINFFGMLEVTQLVSKYMIRKKNGSIINIASVAGIDLSKGNCAYGTSKSAVIAFSKTLSSELSNFGIRVNVIAPGLTNTDMAKTCEAKKEREALEKGTKPFDRIAEPEEISYIATFLASDKASFINGETIRVDGGNRFL